MNNNQELAKAIKNPTIRKTIYLIYLTAALTIGTIHATYTTLNTHPPTWVTATQTAIAYLAIPLGGLAAANTTTQNPPTQTTTTTN